MTMCKSSLVSLRDLWDQFGKMLFDVKSQARVHECSTEGLCFDESFYNDQQSEKNMEMDLVKVTRKYTEQEQKHMKREARRQSRLKSEFYSTTEISHPNDYIIDEPINIHTESEDECKESLLTSPEPTSVNFIITRKNQKSFSAAEQKVDTASRTKFVPIVIPLRIESSPSSGVFGKIKPEYLEAMTLMMSENFSATEALKAAHIEDTVIWKQTLHLPLQLDKLYISSLDFLNKIYKDYRSRNGNDLANQILHDMMLMKLLLA